MLEDPVEEAFRQLKRYEAGGPAPEADVAIDAWIVVTLRARAAEARLAALAELLRGAPSDARLRAEHARAERERKSADDDLTIITMLRSSLAEGARAARDYEATHRALARLRRDAILREQDREKVSDAAAGWREEGR